MKRFVLAMALALAACMPCERSPETPRAVVPHPADTLEAARRLPRDAALLLATPNLAVLAGTIGRRYLEEGFRKEYEELSYTFVRETGHNLLDLRDLMRSGVDVDGPAGVAWLLAPERATVVFVTLRDPSRFKAELYQVRGSRPEVVKDAVVVADSDVAVLVEGRLAMLVMADDAWTVAEQLAKMDPSEALSRHQPFRAAVGEAAPGADVFGYVDVRALVYANMGMDPRWGGETFGAAAQRLEGAEREALLRARARGAEPSELMEIDERFGEARARLSDDEASRDMRRLVGGIEGASLALHLRLTGITLAARLHIDRQALLRRVLRAPRQAERLAKDPLLSLSGALDPQVLSELFAGKALAAIADVDVKRDLVPAIDGEIQVALWPRERSRKALADPKNLVAAGRIGVRDEAALDRVLTRWSKGELRGALTKNARGWLLRPRDRGPVELRVHDHALDLASAGVPHSRKASKSPPTSATASLDTSAFFLMHAARELSPTEPPAQPGDLQKATADYRDKRQRLAVIDANISSRIEHRRATRYARAEKLAKKLARADLKIDNDREGVRFDLSYPTPLAQLAKVLVELYRFETDHDEEDEELTRLLDERRILDDQLYDLEQRGADRPPKP